MQNATGRSSRLRHVKRARYVGRVITITSPVSGIVELCVDGVRPSVDVEGLERGDLQHRGHVDPEFWAVIKILVGDGGWEGQIEHLELLHPCAEFLQCFPPEPADALGAVVGWVVQAYVECQAQERAAMVRYPRCKGVEELSCGRRPRMTI